MQIGLNKDLVYESREVIVQFVSPSLPNEVQYFKDGPIIERDNYASPVSKGISAATYE